MSLFQTKTSPAGKGQESLTHTVLLSTLSFHPLTHTHTHTHTDYSTHININTHTHNTLIPRSHQTHPHTRTHIEDTYVQCVYPQHKHSHNHSHIHTMNAFSHTYTSNTQNY